MTSLKDVRFNVKARKKRRRKRSVHVVHESGCLAGQQAQLATRHFEYFFDAVFRSFPNNNPTETSFAHTSSCLLRLFAQRLLHSGESFICFMYE